jgi:hexokinase
VFALQFLAPRLPLDVLPFVTDKEQPHAPLPGVTLHAPTFFGHLTPQTCPKPKQKIEYAGAIEYPYKRRNMGLAEHAKRVAAEFEFGPDAVRKAVKEFIREMGTLQDVC